ncbi:MAG: polysaccharide biosynthesis protein [Chitinophagaceae bacterium]|nr:polysaccharide biosynthesis protein [Chitinophagaceae bacterium]
MKRLLYNLPVAAIIYIADILTFEFGFLCALFVYMRLLHINPFPVLVILFISGIHILVSAIIWRLSSLSKRIIRYSAFEDFGRLLLYMFVVYAVTIGIGLLLPKALQFPLEIWFISLLVTFFSLISSRLVVGFIIKRLKRVLVQNKYRRLLIYGAGELGMSVYKTIQETPQSQYSVIAFIDDDRRKIKRFVLGLPVYSAEGDIHKTIITNGITHIIIADPEITNERKAKFLESIIMYNLKIRQLPSLNFWLENQQNLLKLQEIDIADLLVRKPIELKNEKTAEYISGKTILVTGAAGSIGSELVRKLAENNASEIICTDFSESALYDLEFEIKDKAPETNCYFELANVRDKMRMTEILIKYRPEIIFHAAAYKHVPILEAYPLEAIRTNVLATWNIAELAEKYGVQKFILVSTDKAVNPTSIMGVTKRIAEIAIQTKGKESGGTAYITTRFGNVLGSNGSVVPLFKKQIAAGGPVTVTHPNMIRYFMTIPEACQLVIEAGVMGNGGEIFVFDMGSPVNIYDLAKNMIRLSGLIPERDIKIKFTGLRPGEKLFEDLFSDQEKLDRTHHEKIMIGKVRQYQPSEVKHMIHTLELLVQEQQIDITHLKDLLKIFVPEYETSHTGFTSTLLKDKTLAPAG